MAHDLNQTTDLASADQPTPLPSTHDLLSSPPSPLSPSVLPSPSLLPSSSSVTVTTEQGAGGGAGQGLGQGLGTKREKKAKEDSPAGWSKGKLLHKVATALLGTYQFAKDNSRRLYFYEKGDKANPDAPAGVFVPHGRELVEGYVKAALQHWGVPWRWEKGMAEHVEQFILAGTDNAPKLPDRPSMDYLNVRNGMLNLRTWKLEPHSPLFRSYIQLPVWYDPEARCPEWEKFVGEVFEPDCQELAWEIPGWLMRPDKRIQSAVVLLGAGANGKSTYLDGIRALLGQANLSASSIQYLQQNRFCTYNLIGKLANICADLPTRELENSDVFKALTGDDPIEAEPKFGQRFTFYCYARLLFSANNPPVAKDAGWAYYRRWVIVPFMKEFDPKKPGFKSRDEIHRLLFTRKELSGFLNKAIEGMKRLESRKGFDTPLTVTNALKEFMAQTDPLHLWIADKLEVNWKDGRKDLKSRVLASYNEWRMKRKLQPVVPQIFWRELAKALNHELVSEKTGPRGAQVPWVLGIRVRSNSSDDLLDLIPEESDQQPERVN